MARILIILMIAGVIWYADTHDVAKDVAHLLSPKAGTKCELRGFFGECIYMGDDKPTMKTIVDSTIGNAQDRMQGAQTVATLIRNGDIMELDDHTKVQVIGNDNFILYGATHPIVKVKVLSGGYSGQTGWINRDDVIDSPLQDFYQKNFRQGKKRPTTGSMGGPGGGVADPSVDN